MASYLIFSDSDEAQVLMAAMAVVQTRKGGKKLSPKDASLIVPDRAGQVVVPGSLGSGMDNSTAAAVAWFKTVAGIDLAQPKTMTKYEVQGIDVQKVEAPNGADLTLNLFLLSGSGLRALASDANRNITEGIISDNPVLRFDLLAFTKATGLVGAATLSSNDIAERVRTEGWGKESQGALNTYPNALAQEVSRKMAEPASEMKYALVEAQDALKAAGPVALTK